MAANHLQRPVIVGTIGDDELDLIVRPQVLEVRPQVALGFAAAGRLQVHDADGAGIARADVDRAAGLDQQRPARIAQSRDEFVHACLQQRLAAGDLDQLRRVHHHFCDNVVDRARRAFLEGVLRVAITAAQMAASQSHEHARHARPGRFALDRVEDFGDAKRVPRHRES